MMTVCTCTRGSRPISRTRTTRSAGCNTIRCRPEHATSRHGHRRHRPGPLFPHPPIGSCRGRRPCRAATTRGWGEPRETPTRPIVTARRNIASLPHGPSGYVPNRERAGTVDAPTRRRSASSMGVSNRRRPCHGRCRPSEKRASPWRRPNPRGRRRHRSWRHRDGRAATAPDRQATPSWGGPARATQKGKEKRKACLCVLIVCRSFFSPDACTRRDRPSPFGISFFVPLLFFCIFILFFGERERRETVAKKNPS
jgi:hypothetical protein